MYSPSSLYYPYVPPECEGLPVEDRAIFVLRPICLDDIEAAEEIEDPVAKAVDGLARCLVRVDGLEGPQAGVPFVLPPAIADRGQWLRSIPGHWFRGLSERLARAARVDKEEERGPSE